MGDLGRPPAPGMGQPSRGVLFMAHLDTGYALPEPAEDSRHLGTVVASPSTAAAPSVHQGRQEPLRDEGLKVP